MRKEENGQAFVEYSLVLALIAVLAILALALFGSSLLEMYQDITYGVSDIELLAQLITAEAQGEPYEGQVAIGAVVMNRISSTQFPNSIAAVIKQGGQFESYTQPDFGESYTLSAMLAAKAAMRGRDPTGGALYYYNPDNTDDAWIRTRQIICTIGNHVFCK